MDAAQQSEKFLEPSMATVVSATLLALATVVLSLAVFFWGQPLLLAWLTDPMVDAEVRAVRSARVAATVIGALVLMGFGLAVWLGWVARCIRTQGVFPPSAYPVLTKTRQVHGQAAQRKAREHAAACALVVLLEVAVLGAMFYFLPLLETLRNFR